MDALPQSVLDIINSAVTQAVQETIAALQQSKPQAAQGTAATLQQEKPQAAPDRNYFKITEKLLYSYPALKRIVSDKAGYTRVELQERSRSIVRFNSSGQWKSRDDAIEDMERDKEAEYNTTLKDFRRIERVIKQFQDRKEFVVIRLYYFNENEDGTPKQANEPEATWEELSLILEKDIKTLRRWRSKIVNEMAIALFGIEAAIQAGTIGKE